MGREIRKVAKEWQHPKIENGNWQPMFNQYYLEALSEWLENHSLWLIGKHPSQTEFESAKDYKFYAQWNGNPPDVEYYRHEYWTEEQACCFQYYETVTEGTPISPVFETLQELEDWLVDNEGHSRKSAKAFCQTGYAITMVMSSNGIKRGVDMYDDE